MDLYIGNKLIAKTDRAVIYDEKGNPTIVKSIDYSMYQVYSEVARSVVVGNTVYHINKDKTFTTSNAECEKCIANKETCSAEYCI
jgi:hypothetical protein